MTQKSGQNVPKRASLSARQKKFVAAMLTSTTIKEAAVEAGIGERTARRYLKDPRVRRAISQEFDVVFGQVARLATRAAKDSIIVLQNVQIDQDNAASVRVAAARALLQAAWKLKEALDLAERVAVLEESMEVGK